MEMQISPVIYPSFFLSCEVVSTLGYFNLDLLETSWISEKFKGSLTWLSRQYSINFIRLSPVTTPAGTISIRPILNCVEICKEQEKRVFIWTSLRESGLLG